MDNRLDLTVHPPTRRKNRLDIWIIDSCHWLYSYVEQCTTVMMFTDVAMNQFTIYRASIRIPVIWFEKLVLYIWFKEAILVFIDIAFLVIIYYNSTHLRLKYYENYKLRLCINFSLVLSGSHSSVLSTRAIITW